MLKVRIPEIGMFQYFLIIRDGRLDAIDHHVVQRAAAAFHDAIPGERPDGELGAHRIEIRRNLIAAVHGGIDPHARAARRIVSGDFAEARQKTVLRIFGIDAELHCVAAKPDVFLLVLQLEAVGDANLLLHDVDAGDGLRHGVLDLDAGIHFHEIKIRRPDQAGTRRCRHFHSPRHGRLDSQFADIFALLPA